MFGNEILEACEFGSLNEAKEILGLMMRHWNIIAGALLKGDGYVPLLMQDENGVAHGGVAGEFLVAQRLTSHGESSPTS